MPVNRELVALLVLGSAACGPESDEPLADASWVVGRYATGGCAWRLADGKIDTRMEGCVSKAFAEVEFFDDGTVESVFFGCLTTPENPEYRENAKWRATEDEGRVEILPREEDATVSVFYLSLGATKVEVRPSETCGQLYVEGVFDEAQTEHWDVLHEGDFHYLDPFPTDGCEMEAVAVDSQQCEGAGT